MSVTRHQERADTDLSVIKAYLSHYGVAPEQEKYFIKTIESYARHKVWAAFAKQEEAIQRLEEEEQA